MFPTARPRVAGAVRQGNAAVFSNVASTGQLCLSDGGPGSVYNTDSSAASHVLTAANLTGSSTDVVLALTGVLTAGETATTDTAANIVAAMASAAVGASYKLRIINESTGAFSWTIAGGTGVTVTGTATIAQNAWREFMVSVTAVGATPAVTLQNVGSGTFP